MKKNTLLLFFFFFVQPSSETAPGGLVSGLLLVLYDYNGTTDFLWFVVLYLRQLEHFGCVNQLCEQISGLVGI